MSVGTYIAGTRGTPSAFAAEYRAVDPKPIVLLAIETGTTPATIRYTSNETDFVWPSSGGDTFSARPFEFASTTIDPIASPEVSITIGDVDESIDTWLSSTDFRHEKVTRWIIDRDLVTATTHAVKDVWRITRRERAPETFTFVAEPLSAILSRVSLPARTLTRDDFPGIRPEGIVT